MKKLILIILMCFIFVMGFRTVFASTTTLIAVDGKLLSIEKPVVLNSRVLVQANILSEALKAKLVTGSDTDQLQFSGKDLIILLKVGDASALVNNELFDMDVAPVRIGGVVMVPLRFVAESLNCNVDWNPDEGRIDIYTDNTALDVSRGTVNRKSFTVVIDPGHGGSETGAIYNGISEKDLNLDIAKRLNDLLKKQGVKTYMTRVNDSYVGLYTRSALANRTNADLLISVHNNAGSTGMSGSMALYYPGSNNSRGDLTAREFAAIVQGDLTGQLSTKNLGVIPRPHLAVLRTSKMPAVIAEVAYMTNKTELGRLKSSTFKQKAAEALKKAVMSALNGI